MELLDLMLKRRSIRKYTGEAIPEEKLQKVIQAGLAAPTSRNQRPWEFYVVRDRKTLKKLSTAKAAGGAFLEGADAAIIAASDSLKADTWIEDDSIAMSFMHLMATEQELGSCWIQIHLRKTAEGTSAEDSVRQILGLPDHMGIVGILALGVPAQEPPAYAVGDLQEEKVHRIG